MRLASKRASLRPRCPLWRSGTTATWLPWRQRRRPSWRDPTASTSNAEFVSKSEEPLVDLGCRCRGDLSKAHRTCIDVWFRTRGSNKCEICQQVAINIPPPETQASTSYWVWRVDSAYGRGRGGRERGWFSPLWVAFAILIGGLLLDVLISVSLGVSALPVNIIIGVLIVLGLGTALRLALECCQEFGSRRSMQRMENMAPSGYHPGV
uniref:Predicted protein n=1 Tax=Hordeum vulgare subsp. vulgare TaxID=112509 RepID=F2CQY6_HORVV|nr:predicted protein [Hordeum vulgare subsp. vulgare]